MLKLEYGGGWSSLVARRAHNPKVAGSNPAPATKINRSEAMSIDMASSFVITNVITGDGRNDFARC